jgi:FtsP/CotA-like multicopper oxidase with cupredoxin domain
MVKTRYTDGIYGPLVIHSPSEPIYGQYDREALIILSGSYRYLILVCILEVILFFRLV